MVTKNTVVETKSDAAEFDIDDENWNPTPEAFQAFLERDEKLAVTNVELVLKRRIPMSLRDMKDSLLHSLEVIERVLARKVEAGEVVQAKGKYALA